MASAVLNQVIRLGVLAGFALVLGHGLSWHFLLMPFVLIIQTTFVLGAGLLLATMNVYFKDTVHWVKAGLLLWMFVTPIFYPAAAYPNDLKLLLLLNPIAHLVGVYHELMTHCSDNVVHTHQEQELNQRNVIKGLFAVTSVFGKYERYAPAMLLLMKLCTPSAQGLPWVLRTPRHFQRIQLLLLKMEGSAAATKAQENAKVAWSPAAKNTDEKKADEKKGTQRQKEPRQREQKNSEQERTGSREREESGGRGKAKEKEEGRKRDK